MLLLQIPPATMAFVGTKLSPPMSFNGPQTLPQHLSAPSSAAEYLRGKSVSVRRIGTVILHPGIFAFAFAAPTPLSKNVITRSPPCL